MAATYNWGIDLGGTKIEGVVLNAAGDTVVRHRVPTESAGGYSHIIGQIKNLIGVLSQQCGHAPTALGIGTPGTIDPPTGLLKNSNTVVLNGQPFHRDLEAALAIPVRMANDANCFAVAETLLGHVAQQFPKARLTFGIIMGTGVGGGLVIDGQAHSGLQGIGGEWGHSFLDNSGGRCYCGNVGCVETLISGPALERFYAQQSGVVLKLATIIDRYHNDPTADPYATATVERLLHFFGRGVANLINILDPDCIILGGGLSNIDLLYTAGLAQVRQFVFNPRLDTPILAPALGDSAGVFGAALLVRDQRP